MYIVRNPRKVRSGGGITETSRETNVLWNHLRFDHPPQEFSVSCLLLMFKPSGDVKRMAMLELIEESE